MKTPALERTSAAKAGWLIILLTIGWLVFLLLPDPTKKPAAQPVAMKPPPSSLTKAGLRENPDWDGMPEIFAIWADKAEWKGNWTRFAYWNPMMKDFSYYFEAVRDGGGYRFREIAEPHDPDYLWDESLGDECPIRFYHSIVPEAKAFAPIVITDPAPDDPFKVKVDMAPGVAPIPTLKASPVRPAGRP